MLDGSLVFFCLFPFCSCSSCYGLWGSCWSEGNLHVLLSASWDKLCQQARSYCTFKKTLLAWSWRFKVEDLAVSDGHLPIIWFTILWCFLRYLCYFTITLITLSQYENNLTLAWSFGRSDMRDVHMRMYHLPDSFLGLVSWSPLHFVF